MGIFGKKKAKRELTREEEIEIKKEIKEEVLKQIPIRREGERNLLKEKDLFMIKKIKDTTNMNAKEAKCLFMEFREEIYDQENYTLDIK